MSSDEELFDYRPEAAAPFTGDHECQYDCDNEAEWAVEWKASGYTGGRVTLICEDCSSQNHIHIKANELERVKITSDGRDALPDDLAADVEFGGEFSAE